MVWAVTSANHENTRRNPVPYHRREAAIERFSVLAGLRSVVVPVFDTAETDRFAEVTLKNVAATAGLELTPADTVVACSTPQVAAMYARLGFPIAGVEADVDPPPARPWDVLLRLAADDPTWRELAHPATLDVYARYRLDDLVRAVVSATAPQHPRRVGPLPRRPDHRRPRRRDPPARPRHARPDRRDGARLPPCHHRPSRHRGRHHLVQLRPGQPRTVRAMTIRRCFHDELATVE
ncbi:hypothetical protein [Micromonospora haikouensis]|uniref:hypothetical protein n=1 Tax=Micromonospora haikouensis TaxID=686309 RepID=UPI0033E314DE